METAGALGMSPYLLPEKLRIETSDSGKENSSCLSKQDGSPKKNPCTGGEVVKKPGGSTQLRTPKKKKEDTAQRNSSC